MVLVRPAPARADGFECLPAPSGWTLDAVPPTQDGSSSSPSPAAGEPHVELWRASCLYAEQKVSIHVRNGLEEGGTAEAHVYWTDVPGPCPLPTLNLGGFFSEAKIIEGDLPADSTRAIADYSWTAQADPFNGGMRDLAQT